MVAFYALRQPLRIWTQPSLLRHLHPNVAESSQDSKAFLRRHRDVLADRELVERVRARWTGLRPIVPTHAEVDEWIAVLGQLRLFFALQAFTRTTLRSRPPARPLRGPVPHTPPVSHGERWGVVVFNDDHTPFAVACHVLRTVCELDVDTARNLTTLIDRGGSAGVGSYDRETAESVALRLVRAGLRAKVQRNATDDEEIFSARRVGEGVLVVVPEQFARAWEPAFRMVENVYRRNSVVAGLRFPRPVMTRRPLLRRMFPDISESRWRSALLRRRHRKVLADHALVGRVWKQWINAEPLTLTLEEAEEWIVVLGQIRALFLLMRKATPLHFQVLAYIQQQLVTAVDPEVLPPADEPVAVGKTATGQTG